MGACACDAYAFGSYVCKHVKDRTFEGMKIFPFGTTKLRCFFYTIKE